MKLILIDNYNRDTVPDILLSENLSDAQAAKELTIALRRYNGTSYWPKLVPDDYKLSRGLEDLI
jgi:hypothetical protein